MFDETSKYIDRANKRDTALNTKRLVAMKELELARQSGDKSAENAAIQELRGLDREGRINDKLDTFYFIVVLIVLGLLIWLFSPLIGGLIGIFFGD